MRPLIELSESLLRDVGNFGVTSIEQTRKIDRLVSKLEAIESEDLIINKIKGLIQKHGRDIEGINSDKDKVLFSLLNQLGYNKLVSLLEEIPSW